jgi:hypothetical protein
MDCTPAARFLDHELKRSTGDRSLRHASRFGLTEAYALIARFNPLTTGST